MTVNENLLRDILRLIVWYPLRWIIIVLPVRLGIKLLSFMGDIHYVLSRGKKQMLRENISRIKALYLDGEAAVREYFRNYYIDRLFIFILPRFGCREVKRFVEIQGIKNLDEALKKGKGAILVHGHFGPVHMPLISLARNGYKMKQIGNPTDEGLSWIGRHVSFRLRMVYEKKIPAEIIKAGSFLRPVFRCLKKNGVIMIAGDGTGTERRVGKHANLTFFENEAMFPLGPYLLSEKTGAAILPVFIVPGTDKRYKIIIEDALNSVEENTLKVMDMAAQFLKRLEIYVKSYPGYMHFLDRFHPGALILEPRDVHPGDDFCIRS